MRRDSWNWGLLEWKLTFIAWLFCDVSSREKQTEGSKPGPSDLCGAALGQRKQPRGQGWDGGSGRGFSGSRFQLSVRWEDLPGKGSQSIIEQTALGGSGLPVRKSM